MVPDQEGDILSILKSVSDNSMENAGYFRSSLYKSEVRRRVTMAELTRHLNASPLASFYQSLTCQSEVLCVSNDANSLPQMKRTCILSLTVNVLKYRLRKKTYSREKAVEYNVGLHEQLPDR